MDVTGDESSVDDEPRTPPAQSAASDPGATPTQQKPGEARTRKATQLQTAKSISKKTARAASRAARSRTPSTADDDDDTGAPSKPAHLLGNRTLEEKIIQANNDAIQKMAESNAQMLAEFKASQTEAMEKTIQVAVVSGLSGLNQNVGRLAESLETISKNQSITSQLLSRLEGRLDGERPRSPTRSSSHRRPMNTNAGHADDTQAEGSNQNAASAKGKGRMEVDEEDDEEDDDEEVEYADGEDQAEEGIALKKKRKLTKTRKALDLQDNIRHWLNDLIGGQQYSLVVTVTDEDAKTFEETFTQDPLAKPCTVNNFRYYINGKPSAAWNKGAAFVFVDYVKQEKLMKIPNKATHDLLRKGFMTRIRTLHHYHTRSKFSKEKRDRSANKGRKYSRKTSTFYQRRELLNSLDPLRQYIRYLDAIGIVGMSSDEEDKEGPLSVPPQYKTTRPFWRGEDLEEFFILLDACHILIRMRNESPTGTTYSQGAPPRYRVRTQRESENKSFVKGLPRNFYRAGWLEEKEPGWQKGGEGFVNMIIRPKPAKELVFPAELKE
ncbi:hypothetical protein EV368DRAFT_78388 [Lentinula lateritia]|uniref:Uncharacterized protein n=1 Tax=Lentinula aff. lateritia TaxID=2804960 RepID=A0ACC1TZV9_9AGAR|nr:hypothetical protein F5876DRAFT_76892 [Lentinula aff. lateritia]KAJ3856728.1 hypothetical protein EV368DRAFT_78388 [Lentinula lateritia]